MGTWKQDLEHPRAEVRRRGQRRIDGRDNLRLQTGLLMQADFQVRQQDPRGTRGGVCLVPLLLVVRKCFAQVVLPFWRGAGTELCSECEKLV